MGVGGRRVLEDLRRAEEGVVARESGRCKKRNILRKEKNRNAGRKREREREREREEDGKEESEREGVAKEEAREVGLKEEASERRKTKKNSFEAAVRVPLFLRLHVMILCGWFES